MTTPTDPAVMAPLWRIGIDLDNTLVDYLPLFRQVAREWEWLDPALLPHDRLELRRAIRDLPEGESRWQRLQAEIYGPRMAAARLMPEADRFLALCRVRGIPLAVISHKTRFAAADVEQRTDLRLAASRWLAEQGFFDPDRFGLAPTALIFTASRQEKLAAIRAWQCTHFIDDLEELLTDPAFPPEVTPCLLNPVPPVARHPLLRHYPDWRALRHDLLGA